MENAICICGGVLALNYKWLYKAAIKINILKVGDRTGLTHSVEGMWVGDGGGGLGEFAPNDSGPT